MMACHWFNCLFNLVGFALMCGAGPVVFMTIFFTQAVPNMPDNKFTHYEPSKCFVLKGWIPGLECIHGCEFKPLLVRTDNIAGVVNVTKYYKKYWLDDYAILRWQSKYIPGQWYHCYGNRRKGVVSMELPPVGNKWWISLTIAIGSMFGACLLGGVLVTIGNAIPSAYWTHTSYS